MPNAKINNCVKDIKGNKCEGFSQEIIILF